MRSCGRRKTQRQRWLHDLTDKNRPLWMPPTGGRPNLLRNEACDPPGPHAKQTGLTERSIFAD
jgi:hypothetical protein